MLPTVCMWAMFMSMLSFGLSFKHTFRKGNRVLTRPLSALHKWTRTNRLVHWGLARTQPQNLRMMGTTNGDGSSNEIEVEIKIVTFNILAPCYNSGILEKLGTVVGKEGKEKRIMESESVDMYLGRNEKIIDKLLGENADIICLQEFWGSSEPLQELYTRRLCEEAGYSKKVLRRTSHWRQREDGLACFVKEDRSKGGKVVLQVSLEEGVMEAITLYLWCLVHQTSLSFFYHIL